jgi:hypothetical protein
MRAVILSEFGGPEQLRLAEAHRILEQHHPRGKIVLMVPGR